MTELLAGQRAEGESLKAVRACNDYLLMGPGRSLQKLCQIYTESGPEKPPTRHIATLKEWSRHYDWQARVILYESIVQEQKTALAKEAIQTGLAATYERVLALKKLAATLSAEIWREDGSLVPGKVWLKDAKQIGAGPLAERFDLIRFNAPLIEQFRGVLDDLARETGGRKQQLEHSGPGGGPVPIQITTIEAVAPAGPDDDTDSDGE